MGTLFCGTALMPVCLGSLSWLRAACEGIRPKRCTYGDLEGTDGDGANAHHRGEQCQQQGILFSERELARLLFVRWLCQTGRLGSREHDDILTRVGVRGWLCWRRE